MGFEVDEALSFAAATVGAVKNRQMFFLEVRCPFERHGATAVFVGSLDLLFGEAELLEQVEIPAVDLLVGQAERFLEKLLAEDMLVEGKRDIEDIGQFGLDPGDFFVAEVLGLERLVIDERRSLERLATGGVVDNLTDLVIRITELFQGDRNRVVDDFEVTDEPWTLF